MATVDEIAGGTLGEINLGAFQANIHLPALIAQIDAAISLGLGPLKFDLSAQLQAALSAQLSLQVSVQASVDVTIAALVQLIGILEASVALPSIDVSAGLNASIAAVADLTARLGAISGIIEASLAIKLPAIDFSLGLGDALSVGPAILLGFNGIADGTTMAQVGDLIRTKFQSPVTFGGDTINPGDNVSGVILMTTVAPVFTALAVLFSGL